MEANERQQGPELIFSLLSFAFFSHSLSLSKDGLVKANMEKLTFYALSAPEKLDRIGAYLSERLSRDVARHRYGWAKATHRVFYSHLIYHPATRVFDVSSFSSSFSSSGMCALPWRPLTNCWWLATVRASTCLWRVFWRWCESCWSRTSRACRSSAQTLWELLEIFLYSSIKS